MIPGEYGNKPFPHISSQPSTFTLTMELFIVHG
jgi:hypothetical protein